jgi:SAM-dependent methyltransferase
MLRYPLRFAPPVRVQAGMLRDAACAQARYARFGAVKKRSFAGPAAAATPCASLRPFGVQARVLRDKGWIETRALLESGITQGHALEIGHGPGYLGLEWLKNTQNASLVGLDISPDMHALVKCNAQSYGLTARTQNYLGNCDHLPFEDNTFDAVFTNSLLHEWANPRTAFDKIWLVLKPGGRYFISDLRRDMNPLVRGFL